MFVDPLHRDTTQIYESEVYHDLVEAYVAALQTVPTIEAIVVCGSVIKEDVIAGWSDLDILVFMTGSDDPVASLESVRVALNQARGTVQIGLGIDVVDMDDFQASGKLGGRPLGMSFEVAQYGQVRYGHNPFVALPPVETVTDRIAFERDIAISAELHNWRRQFLVFDHNSGDEGAFDRWSARCVKTMLKLLKQETDPNLVPPFTYEASLARLPSLQPDHAALEAFATAVKLRRNWLAYISDRTALRDAVQLLVTQLADYPRPRI